MVVDVTHRKKKYSFRPILCLRLYFIFTLICATTGIAQENSESYLAIKNSKTLSTQLKKEKIDSLLQTYESTVQFKLLTNDLYDYAKWHYGNTSVDNSIKTSKRNIQLLDSLDPNFNINIFKRTINNLGFFYDKKNDYYGAYKAYEKLTTIGENDDFTVDAYRLAGRRLRRLGDFYKAAEFTEASIVSAKQLNDLNNIVVNSIDAGINYKNIGTQKSFKRGVEVLESAIKLAEENNDDPAKKDISSIRMFLLYNHLGNLYNENIPYDLKNSKLNYDKSLAIALSMEKPEFIAKAYNNLGYLYLHDLDTIAISYLDKALQYKTTTSATSLIYENRADYFLQSKLYTEALQNIQEAINIATPIDIKDLNALPTKEAVSVCRFKKELMLSLITKADILLALYDSNPTSKKYLLNALEALKLTDYLVDVIRYESTTQQSKLFWRKTASKIYANAVHTCFLLNKPDEAFYFMEKNKALLLLEDVSLQQQIGNTGIPESVTNRKFELKKQILDHNKFLTKHATKIDSIRPLLLKAKENYNSYLDSLDVHYNIYARSQKLANIIDISQVQQKIIRDNDIYLSYIVGQNEGFGMTITKNDVQLFKIEDSPKLKKLSLKYKTLLENPLQSQTELTDFMETSHALYNLLIPNQIRSSLLDKKITIFPDAYLQNIPFEALQTSAEPHSYFIKSNDISYAYSASFLEQNKHIKRNNTNTFLGFAPVNFKEMSSLSESEKEIEFGASQFSSKTFLFEKATKKNFIDNTNGNTIIHLASHSNASDAENPWIAFGDEKITLDELYLTQNSADLVVLSACETSLGELNQGEGVMSLSRGFFNTGTNSVLSTLWNVNDKSTSEIIINFYKNVNNGETKSEALRHAKIDYLNSHKLSELSPYYWSSLILVGDANQIPIPTNNTFLYSILLLFIVLIIGYLLYKRNKK